MNSPVEKKRLALRMDDVGASSKRYEVYSYWSWHFGPLVIRGNWLFLKYLSPFRKWGPYRELTASEWQSVFSILQSSGARMTVAVTAAWVESEKRLMPFPEKFPDAAAVLKEGVQSGLVEIANHGLTHCVEKDNAFKPRWFSENRKFHREFWPWVDMGLQEEHISRSQDILSGFFGNDIVTFVPPGNVFCDGTVELAAKYGLKYISCYTESRTFADVKILGNDNTLAFHDRELVLEGVEWLKKTVSEHSDSELCTVGELARA